MSKTIARKAILDAIINNDVIMNELVTTFGEDNHDALTASMNKWVAALSKSSKSADKAMEERDNYIKENVVPFVLSSATPVTAKQVNDAIVHGEKTNKASAMLRRAEALGLLSRDKVRKNANFEYASPTFDWESYIAEYDKAVAAKAQARIERAHKNRN